jgi:hypothetical protein
VENRRGNLPGPTLRPVSAADQDGIVDVKRRNGLPQDTWNWLWQDNPALASVPAGFPAGWVIECEERIVGYLGNVALLYHLDGRPVPVAAARGFAVDPAFRSHSIRLAATFLSQKNAQVLMNTSANVATSGIFGALKAVKIPQADYDKSLYWILRPSKFLTAALLKFGIPRALAIPAGWILSPLLYAEIKLHGRKPGAADAALEVAPTDPRSIGVEFDHFWTAIQRERPHCLLADRSAAVLRWRYGHAAAAARRAIVLAAKRDGRIAGYAIVTREDSPAIGLRRSRIVDLIASGNDARVVDRLLAAAHEAAQNDGSHILEMIGFPATVRQRCLTGNPYVRKLLSWQFWYRSNDAALALSLAAPTAWYGCSYDGDASL